MTRAALLPLLLLAACASPGSVVPEGLPPLPPAVDVTATDETYAVRGTTMAAVARSMRENGPVVDGRRVLGRHRWNVSWRYRSVPTATHSLTDVRVSLTSRMLLPEWSDRDAADPELVRAWDEFLEGLRTHELGHRALAYRAAAEIERELRRITAPGCEFIGRNANDRGDFIVSRYRAAQDRSTKRPAAAVPRARSGLAGLAEVDTPTGFARGRLAPHLPSHPDPDGGGGCSSGIMASATRRSALRPPFRSGPSSWPSSS